MGNETSRLAESSGRARSLSPLPRDDPESGDDNDVPSFPSTMPARMSTADSPPDLKPLRPGDRRPRRSRSRSHSPTLNSQSPSPTRSPQAAPSNGKEARSSKRRSKVVDTDVKQDDVQGESGVSAGEDSMLHQSPRPKKTGKRRSIQQVEPATLDERELDTTSDSEPRRDAPPEQVRIRKKKDKGKGKEVVTSVGSPSSVFDFHDELPPSAQPLGKRPRRDSDSKLRKKRKTSQHDEEAKSPVKAGPPSGEAGISIDASQQHAVAVSHDVRDGMILNGNTTDLDAPRLPVDNIKVEPEAGDDTLRITPTQDRALSEADSVPDGLPSFRDDDTASQATEGNHRVQSESREGHVETDFPSPPSSEQPEISSGNDPEDDQAEQSSTSSTSMTNNSGASLPAKSPSVATGDESMAENETVSDSDTSSLADPENLGTHTEVDERVDGQRSRPEDVEVAATPSALSPTSPGVRQSRKRKPKRPSSQQEDEENAKAFAELPQDDVAAQSRPKRPKAAKRPVETAHNSEDVGQLSRKRTKKTRPEKEIASEASAGADSPDDEAPTGQKQYRSGALSKTEQTQVTRAVERFRDNNNLTQEEVNRIIHENPQLSGKAIHRELWSCVQDACRSRPRQKLINWCRQRFHNFAGRGTWTKEQDDELAHLVQLHGRKWSHIAGLINRHQKDVRDRWRNYVVCRENIRNDTWSEGEEDRFRDVVESAIEKIRAEMPRDSNKAPEELINWLKISEEMGYTRSRLQCLNKWKRMCAAEPIASQVPTILPSGSSWRLEKARTELRQITARDKYKLMCAVRDMAVGTDSRINWKQIVTRTFEGKYERQALIVVWGRLRKAVPGWEAKTTRDCARYLCEMYEKEGDFGNAESEEAEAVELPEDAHDAGERESSTSRKRERKGKASRSTRGSTPKSQDDTAIKIKKVKDGKRKDEGDRSFETSNTAPKTTRTDGMRGDGGFTKRQGPDEEEGSPEPSANSPQASPSVEAQASRSKRREDRATSGEEKPDSNGKDEESVPQTPNGSPHKVPKRSLHGSGSVGSRRIKKRKLGELSSASKRPKSDERAMSVISSDMDDMEDIPATLPSSIRASQ
ncbi:hypothetical protein VTK26DRAFT_1130 [Humicola hyalothermophila]